MINTEMITTDYENLLNTRLEALKQQGNYRYFQPLDKKATKQPIFTLSSDSSVYSSIPPKSTVNEFVNWTSNDYMGMSAHPEVIDAFIEAARKDGIGSGGTRNISGTTNRHILLEKTLAELHDKEAALIFTSAYVANSTSLSTLGRAFRDTLILSDEENHASIIEGIQLSRCEKRVFRHNDLNHLEQILAETDKNRPKIIAFESVYSMSGTIAPIADMAQLAKKYNALSYLDEVHAVGLYGKKGEGVAGEMNCAKDVDVINGTLAKAFGCVGGYIVANHTLIDYVRSFGQGFIFSSSQPPALCAAATASILHLKNNPELREKFHENIGILRGVLRQAGIGFENNPSHIIRIVIGDAKRSKQVADKLLNEYGIYLQPINYPTVPKGQEGLRIVCTALHNREHIEALKDALVAVLG